MRYTFAALFALVASTSFAAEPPLPDGAVARLGTTKYRTSAMAICLSPDGTRAALRVGDGIDVMNLDTGEIVAQLRDEKKLRRARPDEITFAFAPGGKEIVTANGGTEVQVWDATTGKPSRSIGGLKKDDGTPAAIHKIHNCQLADFVLAESWASIQKLDVKTGQWKRCGANHYNSADVSPDGRWITWYTDMASIENYVSVLDTTSGAVAYEGTSGGSYPFQQAPSPDGKLLAWAVGEQGVELRNIATNKNVSLKGVNPKLSYSNPLFSPDGKTLLVNLPSSPYDEKTLPHITRWDTTTGERLADWKLPARIGSWAVDHKNNRVVVIAGQCVYRIDIATGKLLSPPEGFLGRARPAISSDGKFAAVGDAAGVLRVWDAPFTGKPRTLREAGSPVQDLAFSKDGKTLFAGYAERTVGVWDVAKGRETARLKPPAKEIRSQSYPHPFRIAASPDGQTVIGVVVTNRLWAWDAASGEVRWEVLAGKDGEGVTECRPVFSPDGAAMYLGRNKRTVSKFDPRTGKELAQFKVPSFLGADVDGLAISPDGKKLAVHIYYNDGELVLFDTEAKDEVWRQKFKLDDAIGGLAFAPDGAVLTTHADGTIRTWKAATGERASTLRAPAVYIERLQLTADGKLAVTDAPGATALVWKRK